MIFKRTQNFIYVVTVILCLSFLFSFDLSARMPPPMLQYDEFNPPEGMFVNDWMEIYVGGQKAGYQHVLFSRHGNEIHTSSETYYKIGRNSVAVEIEVVQKTIETVDGRPLSIENKTLMGKQPISIKGTIEGDMIRVKMTQGGQSAEDLYSFSRDAMMAWGMACESARQGHKPGTEYSLHMYSLDLSSNSTVETKVKVLEKEKVDYFGETLVLTRVEMNLIVQQNEIKTILWVDDDGRAIRMLMNSSGIKMELYLTDMQTAVADFKTAEIFNQTLISLGRSISDRAESVTFSMKRKDGKKLDLELPQFDNQRVTAQSDGSINVNVKRADHSNIKNEIQADLLRDVDKYISSSIMINKEDPKLIKLVNRVLGSKKYSLVKKTDKLRKFVSRFIVKKNLGVGFATASEVCRNPEGDCSEHAVLLAALGRIAGIPSRVVAGLTYIREFGGKSHVLGYHMWTQFFMDGRWVDFDAMFDESECSPIRIAFATSALQSSTLSEIGFAMSDVIGTFDVEIVDVEIPSLF